MNGTPLEQKMEIVRTNLRIALALRNQNAKTISLKAGISQNSLGSFIRGDTQMSFANVLRVCVALNIPIGLLTVEGAISPARLRLHETLDRIPAEKVLEALEALNHEKASRL